MPVDPPDRSVFSIPARTTPVLIAAALAVAVIFALDLKTPLGIGIPFLYLLVVLVAIGVRASDRVLLAIATICTALAVIKLVFVPVNGIPEFGQNNRVIFTLLVWASTGLELARRRFEHKVRAAENRFSALFNQVVVGIGEISPDNRLVLVNRRFSELAHRPVDALRRLRIEDLVHPADQPRLQEQLQRLRATGDGFAIELRFVAPAGDERWVGCNCSLVDGAAGGRHVVTVVEDIGERRKLEATRQRFNQELERLVLERTEALRAANEGLQKEIGERQRAERTVNDYALRLQGLTRQLVEAQEVERKNLAAELHDRIGQNLSALSISLNLGLAQLPAEAALLARPRIDDALALVERTTELVRGVMEELHPALLDQYGLDVALRWYGEEYAARTGLALAHEASELFPRLRPQVETALFRIGQEALTNIAKHAQATHVVVSLMKTPAAIAMKITDDGIGIPNEIVRDLAAGSGWGMTIMKERARSIGAELTIEAQDGGTRICVAVANGAWEIGDDDIGSDR